MKPPEGPAGRLAIWLSVIPCAAAMFFWSQAARSGSALAEAVSSRIDFQRDVRPILSGHCFKCHGPDAQARKSNLRLDVRDSATGAAKSGDRAIVPGDPEASQLIVRIFSMDEDEVMPPPATKHPLSKSQKQALKRWIAEGAEYAEHWAFIPPKQAALPPVDQTDWPRNPIDYFVLARLEREHLRPSPQADKYTLVRRLYLDLIGLPPTPEEADAFVESASPDAYTEWVDRLLASPHYGERWARRWLDLARYADTNGYEKDRRRSIWPYRDWVIDAINADMPFDRFTIEQIAGDMLPNATIAQRIATGFHRNTMLNEEGGIDPLEFRFHAMVDRVNTTATAWLGLTMGCAQCHTHKFDPIAHENYYQFMALMNNADEPDIEVPDAGVAARRAEIEATIAALRAGLADRFPVEETRWRENVPVRIQTASGSMAAILPDGSVRFSGPADDKDRYEFEFETVHENIAAIQVEILSDPDLPKNGPGRSAGGDAVLSELKVWTAPSGSTNEWKPVRISAAVADVSIKEHPIANAIDDKTDTGWQVNRTISPSAVQTARFMLEAPVRSSSRSQWLIAIDQQAGKQQNLGRLRFSFGTRIDDERPLAARRRDHLERQFDVWLERERSRAVRWTLLRPVEAKANSPLLSIEEDDSVVASGDQTKSDTYDLKFKTDLRGISAIRIEAMPDERLPKRGPGRVYYEGPIGDFTLTEIRAFADDEPLPFSRATHSYASGRFTAEAAIDGNPQTGWSIDGGQGRAHRAVFNFASPLEEADALRLQLLFERHFAAGLGRFQVWATTFAGIAEARDISRDLEELLLRPAEQCGVEERRMLLEYFLSVAPELREAREELMALRNQMPNFPTTLVLAERPANNPRPTFVHHRGEFLQPKERVEPAAPPVLHPFPAEAPGNRLALARWLVDPRNPLVGRVVMNRHWAAFFGNGLVRTVQDFGFQGELPSHPQLLDWLAVELVNQGWSIKKMHRLMVTSATYQQSSSTTPGLLERDPENSWLGRGPRVRLEAESLRDLALRSSGLFSPKIGGPSVFPPQPPGVTTEGTYGQLEWKVSDGGDRYRRGLYTFSKRTAPYAMFTTFDAPSGEACVARRESSNTPLQALTLLNDAVFVEAAQALGTQMAARPGDDASRAAHLFRRCLTRLPSREEIALLVEFYRKQKQRIDAKELDPVALAGPGPGVGPLTERAAWATVARALLNLDATVTKR